MTPEENEALLSHIERIATELGLLRRATEALVLHAALVSSAADELPALVKRAKPRKVAKRRRRRARRGVLAKHLAETLPATAGETKGK